MNKLLYIICFLYFVFSSYRTEEGSKNCIRWSANRKLKMSDFHIVDYQLPDNASAQAFTGILMEYYPNSPSKYKAYAIFDTLKSVWNINAVINKERVLMHEQTHFDISEYMSQQLNIELFKSETTSRGAMKLYGEFQYKLDSMQRLYDKETDNSMDSTIQKKWSKYVRDLIFILH